MHQTFLSRTFSLQGVPKMILVETKILALFQKKSGGDRVFDFHPYCDKQPFKTSLPIIVAQGIEVLHNHYSF